MSNKGVLLDENQIATGVIAAVSDDGQDAPPARPAPKKFGASIYPKDKKEIPLPFAQSVQRLEKALNMPVWMLIQQNQGGDMSGIDWALNRAFFNQRNEIKAKEPVALLLESGGGQAEFAFRIARLFQRRASEFVVVVPSWAKSAATLMALGATKLIMGRDAELGPLDLQLFDPEKEGYDSALNSVQSLERLNAFAMTAIDQSMQLLLLRTRNKKLEPLFPHVFSYATSFLKPLLEKIDTVELTKKSRDLKVAEQYAVRLMRGAGYQWDYAQTVARDLVEVYPTHGFAIDRQEAETRKSKPSGDLYGLGLKVAPLDDNLDSILNDMLPFCDSLTVMGTLKEI